MTEFDICDVAKVVRCRYTELIRSRGGIYRLWSPSKRHELTWTKIAQLCLDFGLDPQDHVDSALAVLQRPYPEKLLGMHAVERTKEYSAALSKNEHMFWRAQIAQLRGCINSGDTIESALAGGYESFSAAFVCITAYMIGNATIAKQFKTPAEIEFKLNPRLKDLLLSYGDKYPEAVNYVIS